MQHVTSSRTIAAPAAKLWPLVADVTKIQLWNPRIQHVDLLSASPIGPTAARRCHFRDGSSVREDVVACDEGERVRLRLTEFALPMKRIEAEFTLSPEGEGTTTVAFTMHYEVKYGLFGKLLGATLMPGQLKKVTSLLLAGLDHHATTGEPVGKDFVAPAS